MDYSKTVNALKALYEELGGSSNDVEGLAVIPDVIMSIASLIHGGGVVLPAVSGTDNGKILKVSEGAWTVGAAELPTVTTTDNGKVLKVVEGVWAAAEDEV